MESPEPHEPAERGAVTGVLILDKPSGITSRALVDRVACLFPRIKVGHAGTLDPLASGILIICVGTATRLVGTIQELAKSYRTVVRLGARSDTLDADGRVVEEACPRVPDREEIDQAMPRFLGQIDQLPPEYSAVKVKGRRAYDLARAGRTVELAPRSVRIDRIAVGRYVWPRLELEIDCGSGTYIRSVARDLGAALGCGGYVEKLARIRVGPFTLREAVGPDDLSSESIDRYLRPALDAVPNLPRLRLGPSELEAVAHGRRLATSAIGGARIPDGRVALIDSAGKLIALGDVVQEEGWCQPRKVLI
jgi:tRNA pseudouridine55 synthase